VDGFGFEVVGVLAPGMQLPDASADLWMPAGFDPAAQPINSHYLHAVGRRVPGASLAAVEAELRGELGEFVARYPTAYDAGFMRQTGFGVAVRDLRDTVVGDIRATLWILLGAVGIVLAIALANVANLYLVRTEARARDVAIRTALGAGRGQLATFFYTETCALAGAAALLGLALAYGGLQMLIALAPPDVPRLSEIALGARSIAFTVGLTLLVGFVLGSFPLLRFARSAPSNTLVGTRSFTAGRRHNAIQGSLVVGQVALALVLLAAAGLLLRSFEKLRAVDPGFDPENLLTLAVALPFPSYPEHDAPAVFQAEVLRRTRDLPGVASAAAVTDLPLQGLGNCTLLFTESGLGMPGGSTPAPCLPHHHVSADYFSTMGIPIVAGRQLEARDEQTRNGSALISRVLADRLWPGESAVGKRLRPYGWGEPWYTVVGVAGDVRHAGLDAPAAEIVYYPLQRIPDQPWNSTRYFSIVVRPSAGAPLALAEPVRRIIADMDPDVAIANIRTMDAVVAQSTARTSFAMMLLAVAATVALLLGAIGLYGVISYVVSQRRREMGIRMAVGARTSQVAGMVLGRSLRLALIGIGIGMVGALAVNRVLQSLLFEISATDPLTLAAVSLLLLVVSLVASYLPARRAGNVDPVEALRTE
jgi:predicted permease